MSREEIIKRIASNIAEIRAKKGLTLARVSSRCGVSIPHICRIGTQSRLPTIDTLLRISHGLRVELSSVLRGLKHG